LKTIKKRRRVGASGLRPSTGEGSIMEERIDAFDQLQAILWEEKMEFSDIIRQWNYIEKITELVDDGTSLSQHYQVFNDVRSKYYKKANFINGFPAATGIGMDYGGISIDFIAASFKDSNSVVGLKNPFQIDAYTYSPKVLADNNLMSDFCRTTPKFERAKVIATPDGQWVFVSGTAAISGEESINNNNVEQQTELTIDNILSLISWENLHNHGIKKGNEVKVDYLRAYVKNQHDIPQVMNICQKHFPQIHIACLVADVCRPELLVEIEGIALIK